MQTLKGVPSFVQVTFVPFARLLCSYTNLATQNKSDTSKPQNLNKPAEDQLTFAALRS